MDASRRNTTNSSSYKLFSFTKLQCFSSPAESSAQGQGRYDDHITKHSRKPGGWKSMPYILGNETFERMASIGLVANFMVFLVKVFEMEQVPASNVINIWSALSNFSPLIGAFISDAYLGRFKTIAYATFASFTGMLMLTFIAWSPHLHPLPCKALTPHPPCLGTSKAQFGVLAVALGLLSIGTGGIRPCSLPFGVDQFDPSTDDGRRGIVSFFNWYYTSFTVILIIALTLVVYIQDSISWVWGFGIPTGLMLCAIMLFFVGTRVYLYVQPEGSCFTGVVQVIVASFKKCRVELPKGGGSREHAYYDPPLLSTTIVRKLTLTNQFRYLNKAAVIMEGEISADGSISNPWRVCSVQQVEETKCLVRVIPIWASGIISFLAIAQQATFTISQAQEMDRHLGPNFKIPPGSLSVISFITVGIWLPLYDRVLVPHLRKATKVEGGFTMLQRMGIGMVFSIASMVVAGLVERLRRASRVSITVLWLAPQLVLMGLAEAFNIVGQIEFYNKEFPENMSSIANSLFSCSMAGANYLSVVLVNVVHRATGGHGHPDWLTKDINKGRLENLYFLIAGMGVFNLAYFLWVSRHYQYKSMFGNPIRV